MRVLLIEDDMVVVRTVLAALTQVHAIVDHADNGVDAVDLAKRYSYDAIILDISLPDIDGYAVLRRIRDAAITSPTLILSGFSRPDAKIRALDIGADDYLTKPFEPRELLSRLRAIVRRTQGHATSRLVVKGMELDLQQREAYSNGVKIPLTIKEYQILELLCSRQGICITKELFLDHLYGGIDEPEIKIIDVFICKLRKKLAIYGMKDLIETVWGRGYTVRSERYQYAVQSLLDTPGPFAVSGAP